MAKLLIIGLGEIGQANATYIKKEKINLQVDGFDIDFNRLTKLKSNGLIDNVTYLFTDYDVYMICVSTHEPTNMFIPNLNALYETIDSIYKNAKPGSLVSIESTIPLYTSMNIGMTLAKKQIHLVHAPHRYFKGDEQHGVNQDRIIGGFVKESLQKGIDFYRKVLKIPVKSVSRIEIAELSKVIENTDRFVRIVLAQEIKMACDDLDIDFTELRNACNTKWNTEILEARDGVGGHCLPKDSQMFLDLIPHDKPSLVRTAKEIDQLYRQKLQPLSIK